MSPSLRQGVAAVLALAVAARAQEDQTASGDYLGAIAVDGTAVTSMYCPPLVTTTTARNVLTSEVVSGTTIGWCNNEDVYTGEIFTSCRGRVGYYRSTYTWSEEVTYSDGDTFYTTSSDLASGTRTCANNCVTVTRYDGWGDDPQMVMYGCLESLGMSVTAASELYVTAASSVSEPTTVVRTSDSSSTSGGPAETSTQTSSIPTQTETGSNDPAIDGEDSGDDTNIGLIVGASVGGVVGLALIIGGIFLAYRMGKKRKAHQAQPLPGNEDAMSYAGGSAGMQSPQWQHMQVNKPMAGYAPSAMTSNTTPPPREFYKPVGQNGTPSEIGSGDDHRSYLGAPGFVSELSGTTPHDTAHEMPAVPATPRN